MSIQHDISFMHNQALVGTEQKIIIDRIEGDFYMGRTQFDSPDIDNEVLLPLSSGYLRLGDFVNVRITEAEPFDLIGQLL